MYKIFSLWAFLFGTGLSSVMAQAPSDWKMLLDSAGMKVFMQENVATRELSCKVVTELQCSVPEAITFFREFENYAKWIIVCESATPIRKATENDLYGHLVYKPEFSPIPGKRVDAVIRIVIEKAGESWVGNFAAVPNEIPEVAGFIRQPYFNANWAIVKRTNGTCVFTYTAKVISEAHPGEYPVREYALNNYENILALRKIFERTAH